MEKFPNYNFKEQTSEIKKDESIKPQPDLPKELFEREREMARFDKGPDVKIKNPLERTKKYLRILLAGAMLAFGGKMAYEAHEERAKEKETMDYIVKSGLAEKAKEAGFALLVNVPNGDGVYIAHIGYTHSFKGDSPSAQLLNALAHDVIVSGNKSAEQLLLSLKEENAPSPIVFAEGYDDQSTGFLEFVASQREQIMSVEVDEKTIDNLMGVIKSLPSQDKLPKDARTSFEYLVLKKISELSKNNIPVSNAQFSALQNICKQKFGSFDSHTIDERMIIEEGAAMKTFVDGEYKIAPVESSEIREEIIKEEDRLSELTDEMGQLAGPANKGSREANIKYNELWLEYDGINKKVHREKVLDARENFAVDLIKDTVQEQKLKHGVIPMLYGVSHDFSDNVQRVNRSNKKNKVGLIAFIPKDYRGDIE